MALGAFWSQLDERVKATVTLLGAIVLVSGIARGCDVVVMKTAQAAKDADQDRRITILEIRDAADQKALTWIMDRLFELSTSAGLSPPSPPPVTPPPPPTPSPELQAPKENSR